MSKIWDDEIAKPLVFDNNTTILTNNKKPTDQPVHFERLDVSHTWNHTQPIGTPWPLLVCLKYPWWKKLILWCSVWLRAHRFLSLFSSVIDIRPTQLLDCQWNSSGIEDCQVLKHQSSELSIYIFSWAPRSKWKIL